MVARGRRPGKGPHATPLASPARRYVSLLPVAFLLTRAGRISLISIIGAGIRVGADG
jgi:hypothetical protein